jgi:hypothetical protein
MMVASVALLSALGTELSAAPGTSARRGELGKLSPRELLAKAKALYEALEFDQVIPITAALLERENVDVDLRLDAYLLQGSCLAIVGDPVDAEKPFRFLLRGRPDFDLPPDTPPKILAVFRKVQVEELAILDQVRELERRRLVQELKLSGDQPDEAPGGRPLEFEYRLRDPRGVVSQMRLNYRRRGEQTFSSLAFGRDEDGSWRGALPSEWTASPDGFTLEYFLTTSDLGGRDLLTVGSALEPQAIQVTPGEVDEPRPFLGSPWFWAVIGAAVVATGAASYLIIQQSSALPPSDLGEVPLR